MKSQFLNFQFKELSDLLIPISIIGFAVVLRLIPHPANMAPIAAMALFGGVYLNKKYALVVPFIAMLASDFFIGFHNTMVFVYGSFLLIGGIGILIRKYKSLQTVFFATLASSLLFFLITNFGVWLMGTMYPKTFSGLLQAYVYALPFFRNTLVGDLFYVGLFFGSFELVKNVISYEPKGSLEPYGLSNAKDLVEARDSSLHSE